MKNNIFIKVRLILEFIIIYIIYLIFSLMPFFIVSNLGSIVFKLIGPWTKLQKVVKKNLIQIFPQAKSEFINEISIKAWSNIGRTFFELLVLSKIIKAKNQIKIEGINNLNDVIEKKEIVIFIGLHQSNWEIILPSIDKIGIPVAGIYRHINNPYINNLILKIRNNCIMSNKSFYTPKGKKSAKDIIQGIKNKTSIVLLIDQKDSAGERISFFNSLAKTQIGFIKLSNKYDLKIIPIQNIRNSNNTFTLKFHPALKKISSENSEIDMMENIHIIIEQWIKEYPSDWFLQHNRFS